MIDMTEAGIIRPVLPVSCLRVSLRKILSGIDYEYEYGFFSLHFDDGAGQISPYDQC